MHARSLPKSLVSIAAGGLVGLSFGCIITTSGGGSNECGSLLSHSHVGADDKCYCDAGYTWEHPDDANDKDCERIPSKGGDGACNDPNSNLDDDTCFCNGGYIWCDVDDPNDYSCCPDPAQDADPGTGSADTGADTGSESGGSTGVDTSAGTVDDTGNDDGATPDPLDCTAETEGARFCSNSAVTGPENSTLWNCIGGSWVEATQAELDQECVIDQYEFAYGCTDDEETMTVGPVCGFGPGTPCEGDTSSCADDDVLEYCQWGKLSSASCLATCQDPSQKMTFDHGFCTDVPEAPGGFDCVCCDSGDKGCPV